MEKREINNIYFILDIINKNIFKILCIVLVFNILLVSYLITNKSTRGTITLYGNEKLLNEIGEQPQFSLNSVDFKTYIHKNSKELKFLNLKEGEFQRELSSRLNVESENGKSLIKVKFVGDTLEETDNFSKEFVKLSNDYLTMKKNDILKGQIEILEEEYKLITEKNDLKYNRDPLLDILIGKLANYKFFQRDETPIVKLVSVEMKSTINKKLVLLGGIIASFIGSVLFFLMINCKIKCDT